MNSNDPEALEAQQRAAQFNADTDLTAAQARIVELETALKVHLHTQKCVDYSVKTAMRHGNYHCIADCADSHRTALAEIEDQGGDDVHR